MITKGLSHEIIIITDPQVCPSWPFLECPHDSVLSVVLDFAVGALLTMICGYASGLNVPRTMFCVSFWYFQSTQQYTVSVPVKVGKNLHTRWSDYNWFYSLKEYWRTSGFWPRVRASALRAPVFLSSLPPQTGRCAPPPPAHLADPSGNIFGVKLCFSYFNC